VTEPGKVSYLPHCVVIRALKGALSPLRRMDESEAGKMETKEADISTESAPEVAAPVANAEERLKAEPEAVAAETAEVKSEFALSTKNLQSLREDQHKFSATSAGPGPSSCQEVTQSPFKYPTPEKASNSEGSSLNSKTMTTSTSPEKCKRDSSRRQHHRVRRANVRIQCRLDKTISKTVGFNADSNSSSGSRRRRMTGFSMANPCHDLSHLSKYKYGSLMHVETSPNGGGKVLHLWQDDVANLTDEEHEAVAREFLKESFSEVNGWARYCCTVVHGAAGYMPDFLEYLGDQHGGLSVKHGIIEHKRDMETTTMSAYRDRVAENYKGGTYRFGFLDNISLVGTVSEESGGYFPDLLDTLDECPFLRLSLPWGEMSSLADMVPTKSNDGPILWMRPGEQSIPTAELGKSPLKRRRNAGINELQNLKYLPRAGPEREIVFEDRTHAHADHVGFGLDRQTTAAVGEYYTEPLLKSKANIDDLALCRRVEGHSLRLAAKHEPHLEGHRHLPRGRLQLAGGKATARPARAACVAVHHLAGRLQAESVDARRDSLRQGTALRQRHLLPTQEHHPPVSHRVGHHQHSLARATEGVPPTQAGSRRVRTCLHSRTQVGYLVAQRRERLRQ